MNEDKKLILLAILFGLIAGLGMFWLTLVLAG